MIYAKLSDLNKYIQLFPYQKMQGFLKKISSDMEEGEYSIFGDKIFARVMSYSTHFPEECCIEAHDRYIDIQSSIVGAEGISVYNRQDLLVKKAYDAERDVVFFDNEGEPYLAHTVNWPGYFTMLFPWEAHRPQEVVPLMERTVKKFVIKLQYPLQCQ